MIAALAGGGRIQLKKGGLARINLEVLEAGGALVWLLPPKVLRG